MGSIYTPNAPALPPLTWVGNPTATTGSALAEPLSLLLQSANNLSDVVTPSTALSNIGGVNKGQAIAFAIALG